MRYQITIQTLEKLYSTNSLGLPASPQTRKQSNLVAVWEIEESETGHRQLRCRWVKV
ncbi:hypothetical protein [Calothrix sp. 336/3]|uniref:hypothetical protein n=1 Tax=Calothrix sp. 336/3 TaxID=1337936 RepID=UPI000B13AD15|nr:hypothetical protein [Calothrix sp. 336/3]